MAKDFDREVVNNRIQNIYGKTPIDGNGETVGTVSGADNVNDIYYKANVTENEATRVQSELITTNEDGTALDVFKTKARTSVGGLMYPFDNRMHLENYDVVLTGSGLEQRYTYSATYNYCLHINLGLVRREESDIEAIKDLYSAKVVVDGKELDYTFNKLEDLGNRIIGVVQVIGSISSVVALVVIGIKYVTGSVEEKAEYKQTLKPYLIGAILVFGITNVLGIIQNVVTGF